jgi:hypothetical protein
MSGAMAWHNSQLMPILRQGGENKFSLGSPFHYMRDNRLLYFLQKFEAPVETNHPIYRTFREEGGADYYVRLFMCGGAKGPTREAAEQRTMELNLILHIGDVLYGNVGVAERLDFTVIGPAASEASRIEAMCGELDRSWLVSEAFRQSARHCTDQLEAMSRYQLRGLSGQRALYSWPLSGRKAP